MCLYHRVVRPKDTDGMTNSADPDQTDLSLHCLLMTTLGVLLYRKSPKISDTRKFAVITLKV